MKKDIKLFKTAVIFLAISSFSLLLVMFSDYGGGFLNVTAAVSAGVLFWAFLIGGYVLLYRISKHRKEYEKQQRRSGTRREHRFTRPVKKRPGIARFFSNPLASLSDIAMISALAFILVTIFVPIGGRLVEFIAVSVLVFSVHMHCVLNGINYEYIMALSESLDKKESRNI